MEYELTCCICLDLYKEPITLPCLHSLCRSCLNTVANAAGDPLFLKPFNCPTCRFLVQRTHCNELKENKMLSNIVTAYRRDKDVSGAVPQMVCYVHPTEQLLLYCQSCKKAVCSYCVTEVHYKYSHRVSYIEHLIEDEKESVAKLLKGTDQTLQEKKEKLFKQKNAILSEKEAAEKVYLTLMNQLKTRFLTIKSDYNQRIDAIVRELATTEKAIEMRANEFKVFSTGFESMSYKPDRHLQYKKLMFLGRELLSFSLAVSMSSALQMEEKQLPSFAISNVDTIREAIEGLELQVSNVIPEQELSLEELIEQGLKYENLRAVFDRAMKKSDAANVLQSEDDAGSQLSEPAAAACVTRPASNLDGITTNSTDATNSTYTTDANNFSDNVGAPSAGENASSAEALLLTAVILPSSSSSEVAAASEASSSIPLEAPKPSKLCEKLKSTLVDFFQSLQVKQSFNADDAACSNAMPMELPVPASNSSEVLKPRQALTAKRALTNTQRDPTSGVVYVRYPPSSSDSLATAATPPVFLTSILNSGRLKRPNERLVPVPSLLDITVSHATCSLVPSIERPIQSSSLQQWSQPTMTLPASMSNFRTASAFSVGASGEERDRSPKKYARRIGRKF